MKRIPMYDEDGIDGPFFRAISASIQEDAQRYKASIAELDNDAPPSLAHYIDRIRNARSRDALRTAVREAKEAYPEAIQEIFDHEYLWLTRYAPQEFFNEDAQPTEREKA